MILIVKPVGNGDEVLGRKLDELGVAAVHLPADEAGQVVAQRLPIDPAPAAMAAAEIAVERDDVTRFAGLNARADLDDLSDHLVPDDDRVVGYCPACPGMVDREPGAAGEYPRHRLAGAGLGVRAVFQDKRLILLAKHHCFHRHVLDGCAAVSFFDLLAT
jgi:hypothetical protein